MAEQSKRRIEILGVPMDLGANERGANIGPAAIRIAGLQAKIQALGYEVFDAGDIAVPIRETVSAQVAASKYGSVIRAVCELASAKIEHALANEHLPITLGGDHSLAIGTIGGVSNFYRHRGGEIGLIWVDAHADMNTPDTTVSGNIHGMPLSILLGLGSPEFINLGGFAPKLKPENVALLGIRTLDDDEKSVLRRTGIRYFTMREIDERGLRAVMEEALATVSKNTVGIHLSLDLDGIDPLYAPGVSTPVAGGLSYREAHLALEMLADTGLLKSMDLVELNPMNDSRHQTAQLAVELILSALGKTIV